MCESIVGSLLMFSLVFDTGVCLCQILITSDLFGL